MRAQSSTSPIASTPAAPAFAPPSRQVSAITHTGLAAIIGKIRQIVRGEQLCPIDSMRAEDREELHLQARAVINSQTLANTQRARELALERAEKVITEEGFDASPAARNLARRIAGEALITHRLALEGRFDAQGGVQ